MEIDKGLNFNKWNASEIKRINVRLKKIAYELKKNWSGYSNNKFELNFTERNASAMKWVDVG